MSLPVDFTTQTPTYNLCRPTELAMKSFAVVLTAFAALLIAVSAEEPITDKVRALARLLSFRMELLPDLSVRHAPVCRSSSMWRSMGKQQVRRITKRSASLLKDGCQCIRALLWRVLTSVSRCPAGTWFSTDWLISSAGRIVMGLFGKTVPKTVDNFKSLCACALPPVPAWCPTGRAHASSRSLTADGLWHSNNCLFMGTDQTGKLQATREWASLASRCASRHPSSTASFLAS